MCYLKIVVDQSFCDGTKINEIFQNEICKITLPAIRDKFLARDFKTKLIYFSRDEMRTSVIW